MRRGEQSAGKGILLLTDRRFRSRNEGTISTSQRTMAMLRVSKRLPALSQSRAKWQPEGHWEERLDPRGPQILQPLPGPKVLQGRHWTDEKPETLKLEPLSKGCQGINC